MTLNQLEKILARSFKGSDFPVRVLLVNGGWMQGQLDIFDRAFDIISLSKPTGTGDVSINPVYFGVSEIIAVQPLDAKTA